MRHPNATDEKIKQLQKLILTQRKLDEIKHALLEEKARFLEDMVKLDKLTKTSTPSQKQALHKSAERRLNQFKLKVQKLSARAQSAYATIN